VLEISAPTSAPLSLRCGNWQIQLPVEKKAIRGRIRLPRTTERASLAAGVGAARRLFVHRCRSTGDDFAAIKALEEGANGLTAKKLRKLIGEQFYTDANAQMAQSQNTAPYAHYYGN
jgi:hypothetical protein